jgi:hypothetical protein
LKLFARLALMLALLAAGLPSFGAPAVRGADIDYDLPGGLGHFYGQADGQAGASGNGYVVDNSDGVMFWDYLKAVGGPTVVGYPVSDRMTWDGFTVQAFQKVVFQWRPEGKTVYYVNVFDLMHDRGLDGFLESQRSVPQPSDTTPDTGLTWEQVVARHNLFMNADDDIKAAYFSESDPINLNGLPTAPIKQIGDVLVLRTQRKVYQKWLIDTSFAKKGQVVIANGGDVAKESGMFPKDSVTPKAATAQRAVLVVGAAPAGPTATPVAGSIGTAVPSATPAGPTATPTPSGPIYDFLQKGSVTWEPNCGLTMIKGQVFDGSGAPKAGVTVKVWANGWPGAVSAPARGDGYWDMLLDIRPKNGQWNVAVVKKETDQLQSPTIVAETNDANCAPGGTGRQVAKVDFQENTARVPGTGGAPTPTFTAAPATSSTPGATNTPAAGSSPVASGTASVAGLRVVDPPTGQYQPASIEVNASARWAVQLLHQLTPCENRSLGLVFVETYDVTGNPVNAQLKTAGGQSFKTGDKGPGKIELWNYGGNMALWVDDGSPSDKAINMDTVIWIPPPANYCNGDGSLGGNLPKHVSYKVVFKQIKP